VLEVDILLDFTPNLHLKHPSSNLHSKPSIDQNDVKKHVLTYKSRATTTKKSKSQSLLWAGTTHEPANRENLL
jgi:hypothetical protein